MRNGVVFQRPIVELDYDQRVIVWEGREGLPIAQAFDPLARALEEAAYAGGDAVFSIKEIDLGMVADVGTLQRLPRLIGEGMTRELAYTGRTVGADEAARLGLINSNFGDFSRLTAEVRAIAQTIAAKSTLAIRGTKDVLNFSRDHSVADGLNYVAGWNAAMLLSSDLSESIVAQREKRAPRFDD